MKTSDFHYDLPGALIAGHPPEHRTDSRVLHVDKTTHALAHHHFYDLPSFLNPGDLLVMNNTRVMPARFFGQKPTGGKVEFLLERVINNHRFIGHIKSSKPPKAGGEVILQNGVVLTCEGRDEKMFTFALNENIYEVMHEIGHMPLPPYMNRDDELEDQTRYQTVYAKDEGAVAAPTAGLHFDEALLKKIKAQGVNIAEVTLHVGAGTFLPVRVDDVTNHHMHSEWIDVPQSVCDQIAETKAAGKRVIAVGTTTVRSLETAALSGTLKAYQGDTDIFIYPGFTFKVVDGLITNFHLPESTLLMLVSAFVTKDAMFKAYHEAIAKQYRFFSYGDAMLIL